LGPIPAESPKRDNRSYQDQLGKYGLAPAKSLQCSKNMKSL
jgi:hypothetical protein